MTVLYQVRVNRGADCIQNLQHFFFNFLISHFSRNARNFEAFSPGVAFSFNVTFFILEVPVCWQFIIYIPGNVQIKLKFAEFSFQLVKIVF